MEIETPVLLAYAIEDSTDIFRISGGWGWGFEHPKPPLGTPLVQCGDGNPLRGGHRQKHVLRSRGRSSGSQWASAMGRSARLTYVTSRTSVFGGILADR